MTRKCSRKTMQILARIEHVKYTPLLCRELPTVSLMDFENGTAFSHATFLIDLPEGKIAVSHWVSPKRTRSYPFARVYDTMKYKTRVTIIPLVKDEGKDGDRDYLQWDTISLMSLLGIYVIIGYYNKAEKAVCYKNKVTNQEFDYAYLKKKLFELRGCKSDALHWNLKQLSELDDITKKCETAYYEKISSTTGVELHDVEKFRTHMNTITKDVNNFREFSRENAKYAQHRESVTIQPKEVVANTKCKITILNFLGGEYYFTVDEVVITESNIFLIEKKHSKTSIPSIADIQDGLLKLILYTNLAEAKVDGKLYQIKPVLGLTTFLFKGLCRNREELAALKDTVSSSDFKMLQLLFVEAKENGFLVSLEGIHS